MNISSSSRIAIAASFAFVASGVSAATLDFTIPSGGFTVESYTAVGGSDPSSAITAGQITGEAGFQNITLDVDGETLDIWINDTGAGNAYFDANSGGLEGGLGSCRVLNASAQCVPSSDDNLTLAADEVLRMDFFEDFTAIPINFIDAYFGDFTFRDDNHNLINGTVSVLGDDGLFIIDIFNGIGDLSVVGASTSLTFNSDGGAGSTSNYYISEANISAVPVPAAVWLLGSALGLLGWKSRRAS